MNVPYVSQLDERGNGGNNCGPAGLAMLLAWRGVIAPTRGALLHVADIVRDGVPADVVRTGGYTTFQQLIRCAAWFDQPMHWIGSWAAAHASLAAEEPVILLVDNVALWPRQYPRSLAFDAHHFIVLTGYTPRADPDAPHDEASDTFLVNDPLSVYARGPAPYTAASLVEAITLLGGGVQGIALVPLEPLPEEEDMGLVDELSHQVAALREEVSVRTAERDSLQLKVDAFVSTNSALQDQVRDLVSEVRGLSEHLATVAAARVLVTIGDKSWALPPD